MFKAVGALMTLFVGITVYGVPFPSQAINQTFSEPTQVIRDNSNILMLTQRKTGNKKKGGQNNTGKRVAKWPYSFYEAKGLFATGLKPVFPDGVDCPPISSPYGSKTRYDGSQRNNSHHNYHNGMDISLKPGTPLLAVADGTVIHKGTGGQLVGDFIWLHLPPGSTGLSMHIFARYQHLDEPSAMKVGDTVKAGDIVALGGATGTTGGHFGSSGYSHLHLTFTTGPSGEFEVEPNIPRVKHAVMNYFDPMGLYLNKTIEALTNHALRDLPSEKKQVPVPVILTGGEIIPNESKIVWPLACN